MPSAPEIHETNYIPCLHFVNSWLYVNYIFLDSDERLKFARATHEYLMEQIQYNQLIGISSGNIGQNLNLSHPCKSHYWIVQLDSLIGPRSINDRSNFTSSPVRYPNGKFFGEDLVCEANLLLNGNNRFKTKSSYFLIWKSHIPGIIGGLRLGSICIVFVSIQKIPSHRAVVI